MFNKEELNIINRDFFTISLLGGSVVELQSQNGDWWMILEEEQWLSRRQIRAKVPKRVFYKLMHRHSDSAAFHEQGEYSCVLDAVLEIINHDDYRLKHKGRTHFDELLDEVRAV